MLDGAAHVNEVIAAAVADGQPAIGITDHGNMYASSTSTGRPTSRHQAGHRHRGLQSGEEPTSARRVVAAWTTPAASGRGGEALLPPDTPRRDNAGLPQPDEALQRSYCRVSTTNRALDWELSRRTPRASSQAPAVLAARQPGAPARRRSGARRIWRRCRTSSAGTISSSRVGGLEHGTDVTVGAA